jgi:carnitine 3-dehydrogenase
MADWKELPENVGEPIKEGLKAEMKNTTSDELKAWRDDKLIEILKQIGKL